MPDQDQPSYDFLSGGGEMGALMRSFDFSTTPLGPTSDWPQSLRSAVSISLNSRFPIALYWGPHLISLYNDAYLPIWGSKHPWALGSNNVQAMLKAGAVFLLTKEAAVNELHRRMREVLMVHVEGGAIAR